MRAQERPPRGKLSGTVGTETATNRSRFYDTTVSQNVQCAPVHGVVRGDTWRKRVRRSEHLRHFPFTGWAFDISDVLAAKECGLTWVEIFETEQRVTYRAKVDTVVAKGKAFDYGCGPQICLSLAHWRIVGNGTPEAKPEVTGPRQLSLFGVEP